MHYINPKIAKLGPTVAPKITCQDPKAFKMTLKTKNLKKEKLSFYKGKASKTFQTLSQLQTQPDRAPKSSKLPPKTKIIKKSER